MKKLDYSDKTALVKQKSKERPDNYDFAMYLAERLEYFSDRFSNEHVEYFDLLWKEMKSRLKKD